ncbi:MAG TPA: MATE family efflux transporter [Clostridiales bacterium]|nr:MATE family efflux transporter [Clostridiales bacterium]HQP69645.1 MATE family efflux transporter [Clostridiales bacterium]
MAKKTDLTQGPVGKNITHQALGMMVGMLSMVGYNLIDTFFVGRLGTAQLAAMSFTFPVTMAANSIALGLGVGGAAVISRAVGSKNHDEVKRLTTNSIYLGFIIVAAIMVIGFTTMDLVFTSLGAKGEILVMIKKYMTVWYWGMPFVVIPMIGFNAIRAAGNTLLPSMVMMTSMILNAVLDPLMIFGIGFFPRMELEGAALATVFARMTSFTAALYLLNYKFHMLSIVKPKIAELYNSWKRVLFIGFPAILNQFIPQISMGVATRIISDYGKEAVAGFGVATRIEMIAVGPLISFANTMIAYTGQNLGAKRIDRIEDGIKFVNKASLIIGAVMFVLFALFGKYASLIFNDDPTVVDISYLYLAVVSVSYGVMGISMSASATFSALHKPYSSIMINIIRMIVIFIPLILIGNYSFQLPGIIAGITISIFLGTIISVIWLKKTIEQFKVHPDFSNTEPVPVEESI